MPNLVIKAVKIVASINSVEQIPVAINWMHRAINQTTNVSTREYFQMLLSKLVAMYTATQRKEVSK